MNSRLAICRLATAAMRQAPAIDAPMVSELLFGEAFRIEEKQGDWYLGASCHDDYVGYMRCADLDESPRAGTESRLCVPRSFIFSQADIKSPPLMAISMGACLETTEQATEKMTALATGGFVMTDHIADANTHNPDYAATARRFLETPYLWGGRSSAGLDCSGLVQVVLMQAGLACPRDSHMQMDALGVVADGAPMRGELVFWRGHVGILTAPDRVLHANATHMRVTEEDFETVCARLAKAHGDVLCRKSLR